MFHNLTLLFTGAFGYAVYQIPNDGCIIWDCWKGRINIKQIAIRAANDKWFYEVTFHLATVSVILNVVILAFLAIQVCPVGEQYDLIFL